MYLLSGVQKDSGSSGRMETAEPFILKEPPKPKVINVPPVVPSVQVMAPAGNSQAARMTFITAKKISSGFTPDKDGSKNDEPEKTAVESVRRDLNAEMFDMGAEALPPDETRMSQNAEGASSTSAASSTPKKEKTSLEANGGTTTPRSSTK